jgi:hypothetical protein
MSRQLSASEHVEAWQRVQHKRAELAYKRSKGLIPHKIEPYWCEGPLFMGWHIYLDGEWVRRGWANCHKAVELLGLEYNYTLDVVDEIKWWDGLVRDFAEKHPHGLNIWEKDGQVLRREELK